MSIKLKDLEAALTETENEILFKLASKVERMRMKQGRGMMKAVVIEHDWPEYDPTWQALEQRVDALEENHQHDAELEALAQTNGEGA